MAIIANLNEPFVFADIEEVPAQPIGELIDDLFVVEVEGLVSPFVITNRFPTPPTAVAFLRDVYAVDAEIIVLEGVETPYILTGVLAPYGDYLEPNLGQIWPRIG